MTTTTAPPSTPRTEASWLVKLGRALHDGPSDLWWFITAKCFDEAIKTSTEGNKRALIETQLRVAKENKTKALLAAAAVAGLATAGWWPILVLLGAAVLLAAYAVWNAPKGRDPWVALLRITLALAPTLAAAAAHTFWGWPRWAFTAGTTTAFAALLVQCGKDGTFKNDLGGIKNVVEVPPATGSSADYARALVLALWGEPAEKSLREKGSQSPYLARVTTVGGDPAWDAKHVWKSVTFQISGKTVTDVANAEESLAGHLRIPAEWLIIDTGRNSSQVILRTAEADPWPKEPVPWPLQDRTEHDVWDETLIGTDLFSGGADFAFPPMLASAIIAGASGSGKTAFARLLALIIAADQHAEIDIWDFGGTGALKMFKPLCTTYNSGSDSKDVAAFASFLRRDAREDLARRKTILDAMPTEAAEDAKITREHAHRTDIDLHPRFIFVDESHEAFEDPDHGPAVIREIKHLARQGRASGMKVYLLTQKPDKDALPSAIRSVIPIRIALRTEDWQTSDMILGNSRYRASDLPPLGGGAIVKLAGDAGGLIGIKRVRLFYVSALDALKTVQKIVAARARKGTLPAAGEKPAPPQLLADLHGLLTGPRASAGRLPSAEVASALVGLGYIDGTAVAEPEWQTRAADLLREHKVRPLLGRVGPGGKNARCYWLVKQDKRGREWGLTAALGCYAPLPDPVPVLEPAVTGAVTRAVPHLHAVPLPQARARPE